MFYEVILGKAMGATGGLTYRFDGVLEVGTMVEVPVGRRKVPGVVVKKVAQPEFECREIGRILYSRPLPGHLVKVAKWIAEYYMAPVSSVMGMILPNGIEKKRRKTEQTEQVCPNTFGAAELVSSRASSRPPVVTGVASSIALVSASALELTNSAASIADIPLNPAQKNALKGLQEARSATKVLFGVTGSGKTNVYLYEAARALSGQKSVVLLVPEIALTGQLVQVFSRTFGERVSVMHSKQTEAERHLLFEKLLFSREPQVVVGPRSALFAPLSNLGLIIVDEEHENTYFQENAPKYSAVRAASYIAGVLSIPCILGSATPAVADFYLAEKKGSLVRLTEKAKAGAVKPEMTIVDFKKRDSFSKNRYFCNGLLAAIRANLEQGRQTLIFHNRRGSAPLTICDSCGEEVVCPNCHLPLTLHADKYELCCHTCGFSMRVPTECPKCGAPDLLHKGFGTKLLENEISRLFPKARVKRFDADSGKGEGLADLYTEVREGEVEILVGTQVVAKGLDLPRLSTVGVVMADAGLSLPDYAAEERAFQLLTQVIGRVGRGHLSKAEVFIQTYRPEHPVIRFATSEDYEGFAEYLLERRRESHFPPFYFVARAEVTAKTEATVLRKVREAVRALQCNTDLLVSPPAPAFHEHTARGFTWQVVVRARSRGALMKAMSGLGAGWRVWMDPPSLL